MTTTATTAHFTITGEFLTDTARDILLSDDPGKAYRLLADTLVGEGGVEAALNVLAGTHDLAGDSTEGIYVVEAVECEQLRRFKKDLAYLYAGRYRRDGSWWRPVGYVTQFNQDDARYATETVGSPENFTLENLPWKYRWGRARTEYYCAPGETLGIAPVMVPDPDLAKPVSRWVIWEPCGELPHWTKPHNTEQAALDEALAAGRPFSGRMRECEPAPTLGYAPRDESDKARELRQATEDAEQYEAEQEFKERCQQIGEKVRTQAGDDTFVMELDDGRTLVVPTVPFTRWAINRREDDTPLPPWENVSHTGMKMYLDNPDHTDWVLGAGLSLEECYQEVVTRAAFDAAFRLQEGAREAKVPFAGIRAAMEHLDNLRHPAAVVVDAGERTGVVGADIAVFPDSDASRAKQLEGITGVIVENGGALAHFALVSKGIGVTVMRHASACETFTAGTRVTLSPAAGRIIILEDDEETTP